MMASGFTFQTLPLYILEITVGQFLLPFERLRLKRLSSRYNALFGNNSSTIPTIHRQQSQSSMRLNISTAMNLLQYLQRTITSKYSHSVDRCLSLTHQSFDYLSTEHYLMLKYLLIHYHELKQLECTVASFALEKDTDLEWNSLLPMIPLVWNLCSFFCWNLDP